MYFYLVTNKKINNSVINGDSFIQLPHCNEQHLWLFERSVGKSDFSKQFKGPGKNTFFPAVSAEAPGKVFFATVQIIGKKAQDSSTKVPGKVGLSPTLVNRREKGLFQVSEEAPGKV